MCVFLCVGGGHLTLCGGCSAQLCVHVCEACCGARSGPSNFEVVVDAQLVMRTEGQGWG